MFCSFNSLLLTVFAISSCITRATVPFEFDDTISRIVYVVDLLIAVEMFYSVADSSRLGASVAFIISMTRFIAYNCIILKAHFDAANDMSSANYVIRDFFNANLIFRHPLFLWQTIDVDSLELIYLDYFVYIIQCLALYISLDYRSFELAQKVSEGKKDTKTVVTVLVVPKQLGKRRRR